MNPAENIKAIHVDTSTPDSELTRDQIIERNMKVVDAHFHNENPETVENAIALYGDTISWEAPTRGLVYSNKADVLKGYRGIFQTVGYHSTIPLRRFATEKFVFDDQIAHVSVVGDEMPNLPFGIGTKMSVRLVHLFEMKDGKIMKEIAYEMWREEGSPIDNDMIPDGCKEIFFGA